MNRRGFIGTLAGLLALPFAKLRAKKVSLAEVKPDYGNIGPVQKTNGRWIVTKIDKDTKTVTCERIA